MKLEVRPGDVLLIVDLQNDFLPGGSLAVPDGDAVVEPLNRCLSVFRGSGLPIIATRDWHPAHHCSFVGSGGEWPAHCIEQTPGAGFAPGLALGADVWIVDKATDPDRDDYSAFSVAGFAEKLRMRGIQRLLVGGLATDYCICETVLDARRHGFDVVVLLDCIRPVDRVPGDGARAIDRMREAGAEIQRGEDLSSC